MYCGIHSRVVRLLNLLNKYLYEVDIRHQSVITHEPPKVLLNLINLFCIFMNLHKTNRKVYISVSGDGISPISTVSRLNPTPTSRSSFRYSYSDSPQSYKNATMKTAIFLGCFLVAMVAAAPEDMSLRELEEDIEEAFRLGGDLHLDRKSTFTGLSSAQKQDILDRHNEVRAKVSPTASNMLQMVRRTFIY